MSDRPLPPPSCSLDEAGLGAQRARYARLAAHVRTSARRDGELVVAFDGGVDHALLAETLAIERECCPFFDLRLDGDRLTASVEHPGQDPALDALAYALGAAG